jgi:outer membrane biosynthesis protein TonB
MDAREELKRWIAMVIELSSGEESPIIKQDIDLFLSVAGELSGKLAERNTELAKQCRSSSKPKPPKPPKPAPQKAQKQPKPELSTADTPQHQNDSEGRSQERSRQLQQRQKAQPSPTDQQQALRGYVYGAQNDEVAFRKAAKAITR